jgi:hypothetical protein
MIKKDQELIDSLYAPTVTGTKKITYEDVRDAQKKFEEMGAPKPVLIYNPSVIAMGLEEGVMRKDEEGRIWTVMPSIPYVHNIEVFPSEHLATNNGVLVTREFVNKLNSK